MTFPNSIPPFGQVLPDQLNSAFNIANDLDEGAKVVLQAAANGTTVFGPFYCPHGRARMVVNLAVTGGGTLTVTLQGYDQASGQAVTITDGVNAAVTTALAAVATTSLLIAPDIVSAANSVTRTFMWPWYQIQCVVAGTTGLTATVGMQLLK